MQIVEIRMTGTQPLMLNNPDMSNPLNKLARELATYTGKRKKTEEDHAEILRLKWFGSLYCDEDVLERDSDGKPTGKILRKGIGPYLPADYPFMSLLQAARLSKEGKTIERGGLMLGLETRFPILYDGPRDPKAMFKDGRFVDIRSAKPPGQGRIQAARVMFPEWKVVAQYLHDPELLDFKALERFAETAGRMIGVGTYRLRFGRFEAVCVLVKEAAQRVAA